MTTIPTDADFLQNLDLESQPSYTFAVDFTNKRIDGFVDEQEAMKQAIILILFTERYRWVIHNWQYGVEIKELIGESMTYAIPLVEERVKEALLADDRIKDVYDFNFTRLRRGIVKCSFSVLTDFGEVEESVSVNV